LKNSSVFLGCENFNFTFIPTKYLSCYYVWRSFSANRSIIFHKTTSTSKNTITPEISTHIVCA